MWFKLLIILLAVLLSGCSKKGNMRGAKEIIIIPKNNINQRLSLKIYVVQIYSEEALNELSSMEADQFFEKFRAIMLSFPEEVKIWEHDLIENSQPICFVLPSKKKYWGAYVFLKFTENVENKIAFPEQFRSIELTIENNKFEITNVDRKYKYTKEKMKTPLCLYLKHDDCMLQPQNQKLKKRRFY